MGQSFFTMAAKIVVQVQNDLDEESAQDWQEREYRAVKGETRGEGYAAFLAYLERHQDTFRDKSMGNICEDLGISPATVKTYRMRAGRDAARTGARPLWMVGDAPKTKGLSRSERREIREQLDEIPF